MSAPAGSGPSLEALVESEDLGLEILHPGGLEVTRELARLCGIGRGSSVLDVASGTGESACELAERPGARVTGVDLSVRMLERAGRKARRRRLEIGLARADAHGLPFADATFDAAVSECTTCILDKERAIGEMVRVVKPGGRVGMHDICWLAGAPERMKDRLAELESERPETIDGWAELFEKAGLVEVEALDRSSLIPHWISGLKREMGLVGQLKALARAAGRWGLGGLGAVWESTRIFRSEHLGYCIVVGRKGD